MLSQRRRGRESRRSPSRERLPWAWMIVAALVALVVVPATILLVPQPLPRSKTVTTTPTETILAASDIPDVGWGLRASGTNRTGIWRLFSVHNERILAFLNVTLWVEPDANGARESMSSIAGTVGYVTEDGLVTGADASLFWSYGSGAYAGMVVRRFNVVFRLDAYLESSFALTKSDLGTWAGWQLKKIEAVAT